VLLFLNIRINIYNNCTKIGFFGYEIVFNRNIIQFQFLDLYPLKKSHEPLYLNIGGGDFYHPFWHNLDKLSYSYGASENVHIDFDLAEDRIFPIDSNSLEIIYSSHVIEHLRNKDVNNMLKEAYRCLKPLGYLRITCPDIDLEYEAYQNNDKDFFHWCDPGLSVGQRFLDHLATGLSKSCGDDCLEKIDDNELNRLFSQMDKEKTFDNLCQKIPIDHQRKFPGNHINWFNYKKLEKLLKQCGFRKIYRSAFGQSNSPKLRDIKHFDTTLPTCSIYIEAIK